MKIYVNGIDEFAQNSIEAMLNSVDIKPYCYKLSDASSDSIPVDDPCILVFGKKAIMSVVGALVKADFIPRGAYTGAPLVDEKNGFFFYGIPLEIEEIMNLDENKFYVFEILQDLASLHKKWHPFNDEISFSLGNEEKEVPVLVNENDTESDQIENSSPEKISTLELINLMIEKIDFGDNLLGKSIAKWDRITLETSNGYVLNILPTARESKDTDEKTVDITYKDLLSLLKVVVLTGSKTIEFIEKE